MDAWKEFMYVIIYVTCSKNGRGEIAKRVMKWRAPGRRKKGNLNLPGRKGLED